MNRTSIELQKLNNIRQPNYCQCNVMRSAFVWSGAKFFMDWILPTNWSSKNPIFRVLWLYYWRPKGLISPKFRLVFAYVYGLIHITGLFTSVFITYFSWSDVFVNIYPIIVNVYIGYRCQTVIRWRRVSLHYA